MRRTRRAFTAIEILIVIAIILILVGILVPVVHAIRAKARKDLAHARLKGICLALDRFYHDLGYYPPDTGPDVVTGDACQDSDTAGDDAYSLYRYLCGPDGQGVTRGGKTFGPYITFSEHELQDWTAADGPGAKIALDPWGRPWIYEEHQSWSLLKNLDPTTGPPLATPRADGRYAHNRNSYDIYSVGPDGVRDATRHDLDDNDSDGLVDEQDEAPLESGREAGDDVMNW